jgi:hypothetical protein
MSLSFPDGSEKKMGHRYAFFKDSGLEPDFPIRRRRIEFNGPYKREMSAVQTLMRPEMGAH